MPTKHPETLLYEYCSVLTSLLLTCALEPSEHRHNDLLRHCATQCLLRVTDPDIRGLLRLFIVGESPTTYLTNEVHRVCCNGIPMSLFLANGTKRAPPGGTS